MTYKELTPEQKIRYKEFCDGEFGKTIMFCQYDDGVKEPMYLDSEGYMIDTGIVIDLLFSSNFLS